MHLYTQQSKFITQYSIKKDNIETNLMIMSAMAGNNITIHMKFNNREKITLTSKTQQRIRMIGLIKTKTREIHKCVKNFHSVNEFFFTQISTYKYHT